MICSITATFIILYNSTVSLHFSIVIMIIKNCLGSCSGRNSLSVIFPWQWQRTFRRPVFSWQQPWEAWLFSLLNACEKTNKSRQQVSWVGTQELVRRQLHRLRLHVQNILCFALVHKKKNTPTKLLSQLQKKEYPMIFLFLTFMHIQNKPVDIQVVIFKSRKDKPTFLFVRRDISIQTEMWARL